MAPVKWVQHAASRLRGTLVVTGEPLLPNLTKHRRIGKLQCDHVILMPCMGHCDLELLRFMSCCSLGIRNLQQGPCRRFDVV